MLCQEPILLALLSLHCYTSGASVLVGGIGRKTLPIPSQQPALRAKCKCPSDWCAFGPILLAPISWCQVAWQRVWCNRHTPMMCHDGPSVPSGSSIACVEKKTGRDRDQGTNEVERQACHHALPPTRSSKSRALLPHREAVIQNPGVFCTRYE